MGNTKGYPSAMHNMQNNYDRRNAPRLATNKKNNDNHYFFLSKN